MAKPTVPQPGDRLGRFKLLEPLGSGAAAVVFKAIDELLDAPICVKIVHPMVARDPEVLTRIKREVLLSRRIAHPNVCRVHDLHDEKGLTFISMDYIEGRGLDVAIKEGPGQALDIQTSLNLVAGIAEGVAAAHKENIIHRDLKPQNVMVRAENNEAVILDFGVAFSSEMGGLTRPGVALGTLHWISPEVWRGELPTAKSDIYALGIILYNCLTGRAPLSSKSMNERLAAMEKGLPLPSRRVPRLPASVDELFLRSTAFDPAQRLGDANDVARMARAAASVLGFDLEMTELVTEPDHTGPPSGPLPDEAGFEEAPFALADTRLSPEKNEKRARDNIGVYIGRSERVHKLATDPGADNAMHDAPTRVVPMEELQPSAEQSIAVEPVIDVDLPLTEDLQPKDRDEPSIDDVALPSDQSFILSGEAQERLRTRMFSREAMADGQEMLGGGPPSKPRALAARYPALAASLVGIAGALTAAVVWFALKGDGGTLLVFGDAGALADAGAPLMVVDDLPPEPEPEADDPTDAEPEADAAPEVVPDDDAPEAEDAGEAPHGELVDASVPPEAADPEPGREPEVQPEPEVKPSGGRRRTSTRNRRQQVRDTADKDAYLKAMNRYEGALRDRALMAADVPAATREASAARRAARKRAYKSAASHAAAAEAKVKAQIIDRAFIERKLARFNKAYDRAKDDDVKQALRPVLGDVLKKLAGGQYASANKALNRAFSKLQ